MAGHVGNLSTKFQDPTPIRSWHMIYDVRHMPPLTMRLEPLRMRRIMWLVRSWHIFPKTVVRATSYSYGEGQNWGCQNYEIPEPIVTKFGMGDYVGDMTQQAKIQISNRSPQWGRPGK